MIRCREIATADLGAVADFRRYLDFLDADEIFSTGNFAKVMPVILIDERQLVPGPFYSRARKLYWDFAHAVKMAA